MEELYGVLRPDLVLAYEGGETETAKTVVVDNIIKVNVKKVPHILTIKVGETSSVFDGSADKVIDIDEISSSVKDVIVNETSVVGADKKARFSVPTKTSELTNDGDGTNPFLTQHQSLSAYRTSANQDIIDSGKQPLIDATHKLDYSLIANTPSIPTKTSDLTNDSGFITNAYHDNTKQDTITDLETIRSGASAGATAVQPATINKDVVNKTEISQSGDVVSFTNTKINIKDGTTSTESATLSLADSNNAGAMSPASVTAIQQLQTDVAILKNQNIRLSYTTKSNPTEQEIRQFVIDSGYTETSRWAGINVVVFSTKHVWKYYTNTQLWTDEGTDTVNQFTNSIAGIIKGSESEGQVYAEDDGTGSIVGWDTLKGRVSAVETTISGLSTVATTGSYSDLSNKPNIPTKTSDLTNDSGYITSSALNDYATKNYVDNHHDITKQDTITTSNKLSYNLLKDTPSIPTKTSDLTNDSGFITSSYHDISKQDTITDLETIRTNAQSGASKVSCTDETVASFGFTKNTGTVTSVAIKMNGSTKGTITTSGEIDLGTVITDVSDKQPLITAQNKLSYNLLSDTPTIPTVTNTIPECPTTEDGNFRLTCVVANGVRTYTWVKDTTVLIGE